MENLNIFSHPFFEIVGGISTIGSLIVVGLIVIAWIRGITPVLWRLGTARWKRKIGILATGSDSTTLKKDLIDSGIFRKKNIKEITGNHLSDIKDLSLLVVHYQSFKESEIEEMLQYKTSNAAMIFYFPEYSPSNKQLIPEHINTQISRRANTILVNHRGRLLNDILITFITTSYGKNRL